MTRHNNLSLLFFAFFIAIWSISECITGFATRLSTVHSNIVRNVVAGGTLLLSKNDDDEFQPQQQEEANVDDGNDKFEFNWLEEWALQGKDVVALMNTQERTQRVMLAQMTEDRIYEITKVLDTLVDEATGQISEADMPKAKELAIETRNLQREYKDLVTGAPSTMLETIANLNISDDDNKN